MVKRTIRTTRKPIVKRANKWLEHRKLVKRETKQAKAIPNWN